MLAIGAAALLLLSQVPCAPSESTVVCQCKQGVASACSILEEIDARAAARIAAMAKAAEEAAKAKATGKGVQVAGPDCSAPPNCNGQEHHVISMEIIRALEQHPILKGKYKYRDPRFVTKAVDKEAHCGYQRWHIDLDNEIAAWVRENQNATEKVFEAYLRGRYAKLDLKVRFPHGF
jgi:hypothetical protein